MSSKPTRVLLVDDEEAYRVFLAKTLDKVDEPFDITAVDSLSAGLQCLADAQYDVVLLDLNLRESSGTETVIRMNEAFPELPIVVVSGICSKDTIFDALNSGAQEYLTKITLSAASLSRTITSAIARKEVDLELKRSRERWRALFEHNPMETIVVDVEGRITDINVAKRRSGDRLPSVGDMMYIDYAPNHDVDMRSELMECIKTGKAKVFPEQEYENKILSIWIAPFPPEKPIGAVIASHDITERKKTEQKLKESENTFKVFFESMSDGVIAVDCVDKSVVDCNEAMCQMLGYSKEDLLQLGVADLHAAKDLPRIEAEIEQQIAGELSMGLNIPVLRKDGSILWVDVNSSVLRMGNKNLLMGVFRDVTDRRKAEKALAFERDKAQQYLDIAEVMLVALNASGDVTLINKKGCAILGYTEREILGKNWFDNFLPTASRATVRDVAAQIINGEIESVRSYENTVLTKSGEERLIEWHNTELRDSEGAIVGHMASGLDITERVAAEAHLLQSQKLEAIGILAGGVAHEINNPINGILNYAQLILDDIGVDNPSSEFAVEIGNEARRVASIVTNLLSFARPARKEGALELMSDLVGSTLTLTRSVFMRDQIILEVEIPEDLPRVKCRGQQIQQVLMNLLTNARDALNDKYEGYNENKIIRITSKVISQAGKKWLRTTVEDRGTGIPEELWEHLFDPFFTSKRPDRGTGLGLSISHTIVKDHDGEISVESEVGEWTRFHVDLPVMLCSGSSA